MNFEPFLPSEAAGRGDIERTHVLGDGGGVLSLGSEFTEPDFEPMCFDEAILREPADESWLGEML